MTSSPRFGPWAVVTGASRGIGQAFAHRLASDGYHLVLVSRGKPTLDDLAQAIENRHGVQTRVVPADLSVHPASGVDPLEALIDATTDLDVGLVVSNAGAALMGAALRHDVEDLTQMLNLNTTAHLRLAHYWGGRFVDRGTGGILLVGSTAGLQPTPYGGSYGGAKAYVVGLAGALNHELRKTGVHVSCIVPGPTKTDALLHRDDLDLSRMPAPAMSTEKLVEAALRGLEKNKPAVVPGAANKMMDLMGRKLLSRRASSKVWGIMLEGIAPEELRV